jgi:hypothetical protein
MIPLKIFLTSFGILFMATSVIANGNNPVQHAPTTLQEALVSLDKVLTQSEKQSFKSVKESDATVRAHFNLGRSLRNEWGLWAGSPLAKNFNKLGITHPDDMSSIILVSYWRHLNGKPLEVEKQVACYQHWWTEQFRLKKEAETSGANSYRSPIFSCP